MDVLIYHLNLQLTFASQRFSSALALFGPQELFLTTAAVLCKTK